MSGVTRVLRVPTGQGKLQKVREFVWSEKVRERSGENFEKSGRMILDHANCRCLYFLCPQILIGRQICSFR